MTRFTLLIAAAALVGFSGAAFADHGEPHSGPASPTATHDNPSSCLGAERATSNSAGGDREKGVFGQEQSDAAQAEGSYGQTVLQPFLDGCANSPGNPN